MSDDVLIRVENVSKRFCRSLKRSLWYGLQDLGSEIGGRRHGGGSGLPQSSADVQLRPDEFWAVKDVSFELRRGECLGLIGRNGAGKTTLLRMLNGLIKPDTGWIEMKGRVGALIALGSGFNPVLTGRENIYINGSILGLSDREIRLSLDEIISFSGIEEFIDTPVMSYSSGMQVRLGFAIATTISPDILLLDEVLAVGDAAFRHDCYNRIGKIRKECAVVFVSHNSDQLARTCNKSLVLNHGTTCFIGDIEEGISCYENSLTQESGYESGFLKTSDEIITCSVECLTEKIHNGDTLRLAVYLESSADIENVKAKVFAYNVSGEYCLDAISYGSPTRLKRGFNRLSLEIADTRLKLGEYLIGVNLIDEFGTLLLWSYKQRRFHVYGAYPGSISSYCTPLIVKGISHTSVDTSII